MTRDELLKKICPWGTCDCGDDYESCNCDDCNRVLEEWLDEYDKQIRAKAINDYNNKLSEKINTDTRLKDTIKKILDNIANEMYCKGIDDFAGRLIRYVDCGHLCSPTEMRWSDLSVVEMVKKLSEQLKAGGKNE